MITTAQKFEGGMTLVNARATLNHPLADEISIALGSGQYARFPHSVELAFFKDGEWVSEILPEFAPYAERYEWAEDDHPKYRVYPFVPLLVLAQFLEQYSTGEE